MATTWCAISGLNVVLAEWLEMNVKMFNNTVLMPFLHLVCCRPQRESWRCRRGKRGIIIFVPATWFYNETTSTSLIFWCPGNIATSKQAAVAPVLEPKIILSPTNNIFYISVLQLHLHLIMFAYLHTVFYVTFCHSFTQHNSHWQLNGWWPLRAAGLCPISQVYCVTQGTRDSPYQFEFVFSVL